MNTSNAPSDEPANAKQGPCPVCGNPALQERHCKVLCPNCGYVESCEDLFPLRNIAQAPANDRFTGTDEAV